jgi:hypothetical protein
MARSGTWRACRVALTLRDAMAHTGTMTAKPAMQVGGPRYPSGMCMENSFYQKIVDENLFW